MTAQLNLTGAAPPKTGAPTDPAGALPVGSLPAKPQAEILAEIPRDGFTKKRVLAVVPGPPEKHVLLEEDGAGGWRQIGPGATLDTALRAAVGVLAEDPRVTSFAHTNILLALAVMAIAVAAEGTSSPPATDPASPHVQPATDPAAGGELRQ